MSQSHKIESRDHPADPREISKWTRIYGQNRSLPLVVFFAFFLLLTVTLGVPSYLAGEAYRAGNMVLYWICIGAAALAFAAIIYFSLWGQKHIDRVVRRCYRSEGDVVVSSEKATWSPSPGSVLGVVIALIVCLFAVAILNEYGYIPDIEYNGESSRFMQPASAIFLVPVMVVLFFRMRPAVGWLSLLWPGLYGLHAILIIAGAPILFTGKEEYLNMLLPVAGYGLLTGLASHIYSRYTLRRLKRAARSGLAGSDPSIGPMDD